MTAHADESPGRWDKGQVPPNVALGRNTVLTGDLAFRRYFSKLPVGLSIGAGCMMDGVQFAIGEAARILIGDNCYLTNVVLLCELEVQIGNHVMIGWNTAITDTDFHPIAPAERIADAIASSPRPDGRQRPPVERKAITIGNEVFIGPAATILKGVTIGDGAWIEPGAMITRDVPAGARMLGNPARVIPFDGEG